MTTLTYVGTGLLLIGWIVLFVVSLSTKSEPHVQNKQTAPSLPKTHHNNSTNAGTPE
jgi:hypothetical protein